MYMYVCIYEHVLMYMRIYERVCVSVNRLPPAAVLYRSVYTTI